MHALMHIFSKVKITRLLGARRSAFQHELHGRCITEFRLTWGVYMST